MDEDKALKPTLLRSFLAVAETLSFTAGGRRLGLTQSTISQHIGRLEVATGRPLFRRTTKSVMLTPDGVALLGFAREILAAQDRALGYFDRSTLRGRLRFGMSEDLVLSTLPDILRLFRQTHPRVDLDLRVGLSSQLYELLGLGELDLIFTKRRPGDQLGLTVWEERLAWLGTAETMIAASDPVPLVVFPGHSITRKAAIDTLNAAGRSWHVAFSSDNLSALTTAVRVGFGVTAQSSLLARSGLMVLDDRAGLPDLPSTEFVVLGGAPLHGPAKALADAIWADAARLRSHADEPVDPQSRSLATGARDS